jgi:pilus assembly protein CpaB
VKRSNRLVILVGVLLAVLAFVGIVILLNQGQPSAPTARTQTVLVATERIDVDTEITAEMVEPTEVPLDGVDGTPVTAESRVIGRRAVSAIAEGAQVNEERVGLARALESISARLQPGEKAVAFQVDRVTGLNFLLAEGDHIDIVITQTIQVLQPTADSAADPDAAPRFEPVQGLEAARTVKTVLQNRRVIYVSGTELQQVQTPGATPPPGQQQQQQEALQTIIIVFAGSDQDAELIKFAQDRVGDVGPLNITIRHADDEAVEETTGITIDILVTEYGLTIPNIVQQVLETPAP